jgi:hypothetical protein
MFPDDAALKEAAPGWNAEEEVLEATVIWRMEPEKIG